MPGPEILSSQPAMRAVAAPRGASAWLWPAFISDSQVTTVFALASSTFVSIMKLRYDYSRTNISSNSPLIKSKLFCFKNHLSSVGPHVWQQKEPCDHNVMSISPQHIFVESQHITVNFIDFSSFSLLKCMIFWNIMKLNKITDSLWKYFHRYK